MNINGYRVSATGAFSHIFYRGDRRLCAVHGSPLPSQPVRITGFNRVWLSAFDMESTLFPGLTRYVTDAAGNAVFGLIYRAYGQFDIALEEELVHVRCAGCHHDFYTDEDRVASMDSVDDLGAPLPPPPDGLFGDVQPLYAVRMTDSLRPVPQMAILAFPMLRFCM